MTDLNIHLAIIDPVLEAQVMRVLAESGIQCAGRHFTLAEIHIDERLSVVMVTTPATLHASQAMEEFHRIISLGDKATSGAINLIESEIHRLPELISKILNEGNRTNNSRVDPLVKGVLPRVGARTLSRILEENLGAILLPIMKRHDRVHKTILLSEIDDESILRLCDELVAGNSSGHWCAVVINKVPRNSLAQKRLRALERELQGSGMAYFHPIYFDAEIQIAGAPSKSTVRALQPLFDWIAKSN
ncbi:MAG: hypothetical protein RIS22_721 [Actinomycetota bacterium]|jgi:hypothetical protein